MALVAILLSALSVYGVIGINVEILDPQGNIQQKTALTSIYCPAYVVRMPGQWRGVFGHMSLEKCAVKCLRRSRLAIYHDNGRGVCACSKSVDTSKCSTTAKDGHRKIYTLAISTMTSIAIDGGAISVRGVSADYSCSSASFSSLVTAGGDSSQSCSARCFKAAHFAVKQSSGCSCADISRVPSQCSRGDSGSGVRLLTVKRHVVVPGISKRVIVLRTRGRLFSTRPAVGGTIYGVSSEAAAGGSSIRVKFSPPQRAYSRRADFYHVLLSGASGPGSSDWRWAADTQRHDLTLTSSGSAGQFAKSRAAVSYSSVMREYPGVAMSKVWFLTGNPESVSPKVYTVTVTGQRSADGSVSLSWSPIAGLPQLHRGANTLYFTTMYVYKFLIHSPNTAGGNAWVKAGSRSSPVPLQKHMFRVPSSIKANSVRVKIDVTIQKLWKMFEIPEKQLTVTAQNGVINVQWSVIASLPQQPRYRYLFYYWPAQQSQATPTLVVRETNSPLQSVSLGGDNTVDTSLKYRVRAVIMFITMNTHAYLMNPTTVKLSGNQLTWTSPKALTDSAKVSGQLYRVRVVVSTLSRDKPMQLPLDDRVTNQLPSSVPLSASAVAQLQLLQKQPNRLLVYVRPMPPVTRAESLPMQALLSMPRLELPESFVHVVYQPGQRVLVEFQPISLPTPVEPAYYLIYYTPLVGSSPDINMWTSKLVAVPRRSGSTDPPRTDSPSDGRGHKPQRRSMRVQLPGTDGSDPYLVKVFQIPTRPTGFIFASGRQVSGPSPGTYQIQWRLQPDSAQVPFHAVFVWRGAGQQPRFVRAVSLPWKQRVPGALVSAEVSVVNAPGAAAGQLVFMVAPLPTQEVIGGLQFVAGQKVYGSKNLRFITWPVRDTTIHSYSVHYLTPNGQLKYSRMISLTSGSISEGQRISSYIVVPQGVATHDGQPLFVIAPALRLPRVAGTLLVDTSKVDFSSPLQWTVDPFSSTASYSLLTPPTSNSDSGELRPLVVTSVSQPSVGSRASAQVDGSRSGRLNSVIIYAMHSQPLAGGVKFVRGTVISGQVNQRVITITLSDTQTSTYAVFILLPQSLSQPSSASTSSSGSSRPLFLQYVRVPQSVRANGVGGKFHVTVSLGNSLQGAQRIDEAVFMLQPLPEQPEIGEPFLTWADEVTGQPGRYQVSWRTRDASITTYSVFSLDTTGYTAATGHWEVSQPHYLTSLTLSRAAVPDTPLSSVVSVPTSGSQKTRLFVIVPVPGSPLVAGTEIHKATKSGNAIQTSWAILDQTVKRYLLFASTDPTLSSSSSPASSSPSATSSRSSSVSGGLPYFVFHQDAPANPSYGSIVRAKIPKAPPGADNAVLVYPVPNQRPMPNGGACVLGSDFINGLYAVRWLVTSSSHRHYVMFAVLPGRRPRFARFVDLGQQIVQGSSRTDYVSSLMPGVHYSFLVVPLDGGAAVDSIQGSKVKLTVHEAGVDYFALLDKGTAGGQNARVLAVIPALSKRAGASSSSNPGYDVRRSQRGEQLVADVSGVGVSNNLIAIPLHTQHLFTDWPIIDSGPSGEGIDTSASLIHADPLPSPASSLEHGLVERAQQSRTSPTQLRLTWSAPSKSALTSAVLYVIIYRVPSALGERWQFVSRLASDVTKYDVTVTQEPDGVEYVAVYVTAQSGVVNAKLTTVNGGSTVQVEWSVTDDRVTQYSVYIGSRQSPLSLVQVVDTTDGAEFVDSSKRQLFFKVPVSRLQELVGSDQIGELTAVVAEEQPELQMKEASAVEDPAPRISWTVDNREVIAYAIFVLYKDEATPKMNQMFPLKAPGSTPIGTTLTTLLLQLKKGVEYQYFVVPVYGTPTTHGVSIATSQTKRSVVWKLPTARVFYYAVFLVTKKDAKLLTIVPAAGVSTKQDSEEATQSTDVTVTVAGQKEEYVVLGLPTTPADPPVRVQYPPVKRVSEAWVLQLSNAGASLRPSQHVFKPVSVQPNSVKTVKHVVQVTAPNNNVPAGVITTTGSSQQQFSVKIRALQVTVTRQNSGSIRLTWPQIQIDAGYHIVYLVVYGSKSASSQKHLVTIVSDVTASDTTTVISATDETKFAVFVVFAPLGVELIKGQPVAGQDTWRQVSWPVRASTLSYRLYMVQGARQPKLLDTISSSSQSSSTVTHIVKNLEPHTKYYFLVYYETSLFYQPHPATVKKAVMQLKIQDPSVKSYGIFYLPPGQNVPHFDHVYKVTSSVSVDDVIKIELQSPMVRPGVGYEFFAAPMPQSSNAIGQRSGSMVRVFYTLLTGYTRYALFVRQSKDSVEFVTVVSAGSMPVSGHRVTFSAGTLAPADSYHFYVAPLVLPPDHRSVAKLQFSVPSSSSVRRFSVLYRRATSGSRVGLLTVVQAQPGQSALSTRVQGLGLNVQYEFYRVEIPNKSNAQGSVVSSSGGTSIWRLSYTVDQAGANQFALFSQEAGTSQLQFLQFIEINTMNSAGVPVGATLHAQVDGLPEGKQQTFYVLPVRLNSSEKITNVEIKKLD